MQILKITLGFLAFVLAWSLLFRTGLIFRLNSWLKENVFNDQVVLYSRRRLALLLFFLGLISLFSGVQNFMQEPVISPQAVKLLLDDARNNYKKKQYQRVITVSRTLLKSEPRNLEARELLANSYWALGQKDEARNALKVLVALEPDNPKRKRMVEKFSAKKEPLQK